MADATGDSYDFYDLIGIDPSSISDIPVMTYDDFVSMVGGYSDVASMLGFDAGTLADLGFTDATAGYNPDTDPTSDTVAAAVATETPPSTGLIGSNMAAEPAPAQTKNYLATDADTVQNPQQTVTAPAASTGSASTKNPMATGSKNSAGGITGFFKDNADLIKWGTGIIGGAAAYADKRSTAAQARSDKLSDAATIREQTLADRQAQWQRENDLYAQRLADQRSQSDTDYQRQKEILQMQLAARAQSDAQAAANRNRTVSRGTFKTTYGK